jgi:hypothetical protein
MEELEHFLLNVMHLSTYYEGVEGLSKIKL